MKGLPLEKIGLPSLRRLGSGLLTNSGPSASRGRESSNEAEKPEGENRKLDGAINAISDIIDCMASITIRRLPENTKRRLRIRAARNGRSMEQEARELLEAALARNEPKSENLGQIIHRRFAALGGVDLKIPPRGPIRDPGIR